MLMISIKDMNKSELHNHAHRLLRECLRPYRIDYNEDTPVSKGKMGKPSLTEHPNIYYNLSHADGIAACIISDNECGIDCEKIREYPKKVMRRVFSEKERTMVETAPEDKKSELFFRLWTLKEAYVKAIGVGISYPMNTVEFSFDSGRIITNIKDCRFRQYIVGNRGFIVSVCEMIERPLL
ncbi:MAG: 4'-phosphopantetheinyl transferase superfamily protein [Ruminococcus sp.]|uniref:4'-phosphopantetheinyl transferase family protein n=1 Tax=Ruminococcus sp. TaxID=41978 RepID=UPI001B282CEB|nr:4'-phosphopantetheinyl transferase superfamily protein [Ruminococcus sp.]MBO7473662.1 4'-phosphopantetheinyl transferase superfamily protein [Ruminococcus sp.]MBP5430718.1 4'-phosphopantetheinyl transferase superfamily protein [Ruminococcus sp.]